MRFICLLCIFLLTGCGTVLSLGHVGWQEVSVNSNVDSPDIKVNGAPIKTNRGKNLYYFDIDNGCYLFVTSKSNPSEEFKKYCRPGMYFKWIGYPYSEK